MNNNKGLAPPASQDRVTDAPHEAGKPSSPFGSVPTGAWTPGPWRVCTINRNIVRRSDGLVVADVDDGGCGRPKLPSAEAEANTLLIAAAPEMAEALADLDRAIGAERAGVTLEGWMDAVDAVDAAREKARAALSKATEGSSK